MTPRPSATRCGPPLLAAARSRADGADRQPLQPHPQLVTRFVPGAAEEAAVDAVTEPACRPAASSRSTTSARTSATPARPTDTVQAYLSLLQAYAHARAPAQRRCPTAGGVDQALGARAVPARADEELALGNARRICTAAAEVGAWVNVDAEDHTTTDSTLAIVRELREEFPTVGDRAAGLPAPHRGRLPRAVRRGLPDPAVQGRLHGAGRGRLPGQGRRRRLLPALSAGS